MMSDVTDLLFCILITDSFYSNGTVACPTTALVPSGFLHPIEQIAINPRSVSVISVISPCIFTVSPGITGALNLTFIFPPECHVLGKSIANISVTKARLSMPWAIRVPNLVDAAYAAFKWIGLWSPEASAYEFTRSWVIFLVNPLSLSPTECIIRVVPLWQLS